MVRPLAFVLTACVVAASGCTCAEKTAPQTPTIQGPSQDWLDGALPPSVMEGTPKQGGTLTIRLQAEPKMLNRLHDAGQDAWAVRTIVGPVVETLCELDRDTAPRYRLKPVLAERWEISADRRTTTFHLRHGVTFHDGQPFSAKDVKAVLDAIRDPKQPTTRMRGLLAELDGYETPDPWTVVVHWKRPDFLATRQLATVIPIFPASALEGDLDTLAINRAPVGTGPFRFDKWESGRAIELVRNETYWGKKAHVDRIVFRIVKDGTVATQMFERGAFDLMTAIPPHVWRGLEAVKAENAWAWRDYHRIRFPENAYNWIGFNQARPPFGDVRVRRALAQLIPYDAIEEGIYLGLEPITTCPFYALGPACDPGLEAPDSPQRLRYDPEDAKALLDAAGWKDTDGDGVRDHDGRPFDLTFLIYASSVNLGKLAPVLQDEWRKAGIRLHVEKVDWAVFTERLRTHAFDMVSLGWSALDAEDDLYFNFHSSQVKDGTNYVSYVNPELDRLLEAVRGEHDEQRRIALERQIHRLVYRDQVYLFLGRRSALDAAKKTVHGLRPAINWYRLADLWLDAPAPHAEATTRATPD
ncbi:MAG: hypothetical protein IRZ16_09150 [Myxococcaceae bacterium]|nr:hypothetical protein [Myxococcaceae bacterium]